MTRQFMNTCSRAAHRVVLSLVVFAAGLFSLRAQDSSVRVMFPFDKDVVLVDYMNNASAMDRIDELVEAGRLGDGSSVEVVAYSSPEGNYYYNLDLSTRRARSFRSWLVSRYPQFTGKVVLSPDAEYWAELRSAVLSEGRLGQASRDAMVSIIDSSADPDVKEARLRSIPGFGLVCRTFFRNYRFVEVRFRGLSAGTSVQSGAGVSASGKALYTVSDLGKVLFVKDGSDVDPDYMSNREALAAIEALLASVPASEIKRLVIRSADSVDGPSDASGKCAADRGASLRDYIVSKHPELAGKIAVESVGEDWEDLRASVVSSKEISEETRAKVLEIIDSDLASEEKEAKLKALPEYDEVSESVFPRQRYARLSVERKVSEKDASVSGTGAKDSGKKYYSISDLGKILFSKDNADIDRGYMSNDAALAAIDSILANTPASEIKRLVIRSADSVDGPSDASGKCAADRGASLRDYIVSKHPELAGKIAVESVGEDWDDLRRSIASSREVSDDTRAKVLEIIDSDLASEEKEARLKALPEYDEVSESVFPRQRYARLSVERKVSEKDASVSGTGAKGSGKKVSSVSDRGKVLFSKGSSSLDPDFQSNSEALAYIDSLITSRPASEVKRIVVRSAGSVDGTVAANDRCSRNRGRSLRDYIASKYPEYSDKITYESVGEDWDDLRSSIASSREVSDDTRDKVLRIIDSDLSAETKESRLKELPEYDDLFNRIFPRQRYARIRAEYEEAPEAPVVAVEEIEEPTDTISTKDTLDVIDYVTVVDSLVNVSDTLNLKDSIVAPKLLPVPPVVRPIMAVSTNALLDLLITPNFAVEFPIGHKWSVYGEYTFPWWVTRANDRAWQMLKWDVGVRSWLSNHNKKNPMDILTGHFVGIDLGVGYYDIEPKHTGYQGEFLTAGVEYGYAWDLGKNWRLDAYVGAGWMGTKYRYYEGDSRDQHLIYQHNGIMNWLGPTKAGVSFKYIFTTTEKRRNGR